MHSSGISRQTGGSAQCQNRRARGEAAPEHQGTESGAQRAAGLAGAVGGIQSPGAGWHKPFVKPCVKTFTEKRSGARTREAQPSKFFNSLATLRVPRARRAGGQVQSLGPRRGQTARYPTRTKNPLSKRIQIGGVRERPGFLSSGAGGMVLHYPWASSPCASPP